MQEKRTSVFENGLIWFGAAVSIAEILTGAIYCAPLGFGKGLAAILLGHVIGCVLLFLAGLIGGKVRKSAMETVKLSFGQKGGLLFALLNILQLLGWTAIMIYWGAQAAQTIWAVGSWFWCLVIGGLIILWILIGIKSLGKINTVAMAALFLLTIVLSFVIFRGEDKVELWKKLAEAMGLQAPAAEGEAVSFGLAVEMSVAMPLSWLPLISDYTREAEKPLKATAVSALVYGLVSCWMYVIGMGAAIFTAESDIAAIMVKAGLGVVGLLIIVFSTVTTTFLDAYSAGVSSEALSKKIPGKWVAVGAAVIGILVAVFWQPDKMENFLYLIGSVFAPMIAVQIADFFLLRYDAGERSFSWTRLLVWLAGFALYRWLMTLDIPVGCTLPDMLATMLLCWAVGSLTKKVKA